MNVNSSPNSKINDPYIEKDGRRFRKLGQVAKSVHFHALSRIAIPTDFEREKLSRGIKLVIGGPPHSGKSVLLTGIRENISDADIFNFSAAPDGEGRFLSHQYNNPKVVSLRQKGEYSPEYISTQCKKLRDLSSPLTLIDLGGKITEDKIPILKEATHGIVLSNNLATETAWVKFFERNGIQVIAKIHSSILPNNDLILDPNKTNTGFVGTIHDLDRNKSAADKNSVGILANEILKLVQNNSYFRKKKYEYEHSVEELFGDLPHTVSSRSRMDKDGNVIQSFHREFAYSSIPDMYKKANNYSKEPIWISSSMFPWEAMSISLALGEAGCPEIRIFGQDWFAPVKKLPMSTEVNKKWFNKPFKQSETFMGKPIYMIHNTAHVSRNIISPDDLDSMTVPEVPSDSVVLVSSQGPLWLHSSIALSYKDNVFAIMAYRPGRESVVIWCKDESLIGKTIHDKNIQTPLEQKN